MEDDFIGLHEFIEEMAEIDYHLQDRFMDEDVALTVKKIETGTACQLHITVSDDERVEIGAIPPMYYVETSFMPVFHNIKLNIEIQQ